MTTDATDLRDRYEVEGSSTERYASEFSWDSRYHHRRQAHIVDRLAACVVSGDVFLDVGCGTGEYLDVARRLGASVAVGLDLSGTYLGRLRQSHPVLPLVQADGASLPFADDSFDVVLCSEVIEHIPSAAAPSVAGELSRICRRSVLFTTPNRNAMIRRLGRRIAPTRVEELDAEVGHINLFDREGLIAFGRSAGMELSDMHVRHVLPPVIGEAAHLPRALDRPIAGCEWVADRCVPSWGNTMFGSFEINGA